MKKLTQIIVIFLLTLFVTQVNATVWRVNSNAGTDPDFAKVQQAIDAAEPGDIIQIESGIYNGFTINKSLKIVGTCYDMSVHNDITTSIQPVYINGDVIFDVGSEGSSLSSVNLGQSSSNVLLRVSNIQITRSDIYYFIFESLKYAGYSGGSETLNSKTRINNILITNSKIYHIKEQRGVNVDTLLVTNCTFSNCIIDEGLNLQNWNNANYALFNCTFTQCVFIDRGIYPDFCSFQNNIFLKGNDNIFNILNSNSVANNLFVHGELTGPDYHSGTSNVFGATDIFSTKPNKIYELSETSQAKGIGVSGQDAGIYGGDFPFLPGGYSQTPTIVKLVVPSQTSGNMVIEVGAKVIE